MLIVGALYLCSLVKGLEGVQICEHLTKLQAHANLTSASKGPCMLTHGVNMLIQRCMG